MNYNGVGPWNDAVVSLKIEESRMLGSVLFALNGREVDPFLQGPNMISQPRCHRWCPLLPTAIHRADWSAAAFARLKSVIVTGMKNRVRFIQYGIEVVRAELRGERLPLPLTSAPDTS
jgi:hypothetical protein